MTKIFLPLMWISIFLIMFSCGSNQTDSPQTEKTAGYQATPQSAQITFVELGSVNCIPCRKMQPVMKSIEAKYGDQIRVLFYDVWKPDQKHYAQQYGIRLIPTQVFLDQNGRELMRHEGFFPEEEIDAFLKSQGLTVTREDSF